MKMWWVQVVLAVELSDDGSGSNKDLVRHGRLDGVWELSSVLVVW